MQRAAPSPFSLGAVMWKASAAHAETGQLAIDARAARLGVFVLLQHQDAGAVAHARSRRGPASQGRDAAAGRRCACDIAFIAQKPPIEVGECRVRRHRPPSTSASPYWIMRIAMPMEWFAVAQAVTAEKFGPLMPVMIRLTWPGIMLMIVLGT